MSPWIIDLQDLARDGLLSRRVAHEEPAAVGVVDFEGAVAYKTAALDGAARVALGRPGARASIETFRSERPWVEDVALFSLLADQHGTMSWWTWPRAVRDRQPEAMIDLAKAHGPALDRQAAVQWMAHTQWQSLREYAANRRVAVVGDLPMYCDPKSADVWAHRDLFHLTDEGRPAAMAGVPPDLFSDVGQLWESPTYRWERHAAEGYRWWSDRVGTALEQADILRIDHFRGLHAYWSVPGGAEDAREGSWLPGPGRDFFDAIEQRHGAVPWIAEDLGLLDDDVRALRDEVGAPGMAVLQFGFGAAGDAGHRPDLLENHRVAMTGTHDNETLAAWWRGLPLEDSEEVGAAYEILAADPHKSLVRAVLDSRADTAIVPVQDLLGLGSEARMNVPGTPKGNWTWRLRPGVLSADLAAECAEWNRAARRG
jgi:4-alpha-glucanotransferase